MAVVHPAAEPFRSADWRQGQQRQTRRRGSEAHQIRLKPSPRQGIPSEPSGSEPGGSERATMTTTDLSLASSHRIQELILEPLGRVSQ